jgi:hypothetical protein
MRSSTGVHNCRKRHDFMTPLLSLRAISWGLSYLMETLKKCRTWPHKSLHGSLTSPVKGKWQDKRERIHCGAKAQNTKLGHSNSRNTYEMQTQQQTQSNDMQRRLDRSLQILWSCVSRVQICRMIVKFNTKHYSSIFHILIEIYWKQRAVHMCYLQAAL